MKIEVVRAEPVTLYRSEIMPEIASESMRDAEIIAWADANPVAWEIVSKTKSKAFGKNSSVYLGLEQGSDAPYAILARVRTFHDHVHNHGVAAHTNESLWQWRAKFTLAHYKDKGFRGGFFQLFDGTYDRSCTNLDYTPETRVEVIQRFLAWCDPYYAKHSVKIDKKTVLVLEQIEEKA